MVSGIIAIQYCSERNDWSFLFAIFSSLLQVGLLFLKVGSKVGWKIWHFSGALSVSTSLSLFVQFTTCTCGTAYTNKHTNTTHMCPWSMFPSQSLSPPPGHPAHVWEHRGHTLPWITVNHGAQIAPKEKCCIYLGHGLFIMAWAYKFSL